MVTRALLNYKNNDIDNFYSLYHTSAAKELVFYLKYMMIEVAWGGFSMEKTVHEILWGYTDPFIEKLTKQPVL